jgi:hypothetical protein
VAVEPERAAQSNTLDLATAAELLGYAGAAVSLAAAALVVVNSGSISRTSASITIALAAAGLLGAGAMLGRGEDERAGRMRSVFWFLSAIAVFELMVLLTVGDGGGNPKGAITASAAVTAGAAGVLWWWSRRTLQQVALFGAALLTLLAAAFPDLGSFFSGPPDFTPLMIVALIAGAGWFVLGWRGLVQPARTAMVLGALSASISPLFLTANGDASGSGVLVAIVGVVLIVAGYLIQDRAVSGIGIVGLLWGTSTLVTDLVKTSDAGSFAALVLGLVMVAASILLWRGFGRPAAAPPMEQGAPPTQAEAPPPPPDASPPLEPPLPPAW